MSFLKQLLLLVVAAGLFISTAFAEIIIMKNGDRVAGDIIKKEDNKLTVKSDTMGQVVLPWDQVVMIDANDYNITTADAQVYRLGAVSQHNVSTPLTVVLQDGRVIREPLWLRDGALNGNIPVEYVVTIRNDAEQAAWERTSHPGWLSLWSGTGTFGIAGTAGNSRTTTYNAGLNAARVTKHDKTTITFNAITASALVNDKSEDTAEAIRGGVSYNHDVRARLFFSGFNDYEYDRFQNLDLRVVLGGGLGYQFLRSDRHKLDLVAGSSYNRSKFSTKTTQHSGEFYWGNDYRYKLNAATTLVQSYRMYHDITNLGPYRINFDLDLNTKIVKWLTWNVSISDRFLSDPVEGRKRNDFLYTTGIGFSF